MLKKFTCIICPNGCDIEAEINGNAILSITGNLCPKGEEYVQTETKNPVRNFATSISVEGGELPLCSVRLTKPIPKSRIFDVLSEIKKHKLYAPVSIGQVVIHNVLDSGADVIATRGIKLS